MPFVPVAIKNRMGVLRSKSVLTQNDIQTIATSIVDITEGVERLARRVAALEDQGKKLDGK